jgi:DNA-binding response OmpR family regulator
MPTNYRVLIVEDDLNALSGYLEFLTDAGFEASGVSNGAEALPIALENPPDAVATDIMLPGLSGFELAAALRADPRTQAIPIIGLTAHWTADVHARARDVAMQVILAKPCSPMHLVAELDRVLGRAKALDDVTPRRAMRMAMTSPDRHDPRMDFRRASGDR